MPRVDPEVRRQAIIAAALVLFQRDGFDQVRVDDILAQVSLSKGGFYHHFRSREDILRQIVVDETVDTVSRLDSQLDNDDPVVALTQLFLHASTSLGAEPGVLATLESFAAKAIYLDELERQMSLHLKPYIIKVLEMGVAKKVFNAVDCAATAEIIMAVNDHGNRAAVQGSLTEEQLGAYNLTATESLGRYLGIEEQIRQLLSAMESHKID